MGCFTCLVSLSGCDGEVSARSETSVLCVKGHWIHKCLLSSQNHHEECCVLSKGLCVVVSYPVVHLFSSSLLTEVCFFPDCLVSFGCVFWVFLPSSPCLSVCLFLLSPLNVITEITWPCLYPDCLWQETTVVGSVFTVPAGDKTFILVPRNTFELFVLHALWLLNVGSDCEKPESRTESFALDWIWLWQRSAHSKNVPRIVMGGGYSHSPLNAEKKYRCQTGKL